MSDERIEFTTFEFPLPDDHRAVCAAGRWITHAERHGGEEWMLPCARPVDETIQVDEYEYGFCDPHANVIFDEIGDTFKI